MRISDWGSDVCSSDLAGHRPWGREPRRIRTVRQRQPVAAIPFVIGGRHGARDAEQTLRPADKAAQVAVHLPEALWVGCLEASGPIIHHVNDARAPDTPQHALDRTEECRVGNEWVSTGRSRWVPSP